MTTTLDTIPKPVKELPDDAKLMWVGEYNKDFAWRCSESHAEKAAWRAVRTKWQQAEDGAWAPRN